MHTEFYLGLVGSVDFWIWVIGLPFIILFFIFCVDVENQLNKVLLINPFRFKLSKGIFYVENNSLLLFQF